MVSAEIIVALAESPWDGEAGDEPARHGLGLVSAQYGEADIGEVAGIDRLLLRRAVGPDPSLPTRDIILACRGEPSAQAGDGVSGRRFWLVAEAERQYEISLRFEQIDLPGHGHIAVLGALVFPGHPLVRLQILPAIGRSDIADGPPRPRNRARECQGVSLAPRKQQRRALEIVHPCGVAATLIAQVRCEQDMQ